jgi:hypothetical protein
MFFPPAANGGLFPKTCRRAAPCMAIWNAAVMFRKSGDEETARRLKSIADFIADEILEADQKIALAGRAPESKP